MNGREMLANSKHTTTISQSPSIFLQINLFDFIGKKLMLGSRNQDPWGQISPFFSTFGKIWVSNTTTILALLRRCRNLRAMHYQTQSRDYNLVSANKEKFYQKRAYSYPKWSSLNENYDQIIQHIVSVA